MPDTDCVISFSVSMPIADTQLHGQEHQYIAIPEGSDCTISGLRGTGVQHAEALVPRSQVQ